MNVAGPMGRPGPIAAWIDATVPAMNDDGLDLLARAEPEPSKEGGYAEETFLDPERIGGVYGQDGWGWYADADRATAIVRMLNYDDGLWGRAKARDRGIRGEVSAGPRKRGSCFRDLHGVRRSDLVVLGFIEIEDEA